MGICLIAMFDESLAFLHSLKQAEKVGPNLTHPTAEWGKWEPFKKKRKRLPSSNLIIEKIYSVWRLVT